MRKIKFLYGIFLNEELKYSITEDGKMYSWNNFHKKIRTNKPYLMAERKDKKGYIHYAHTLNGKISNKKAHTLVMKYFVGDKLDGQVIRHLDGNKLNNHVSNLAYGTVQENANDAVKHGHTTYGEKSGQAKLTEKEVREIVELLLDGCIHQEIADLYKVSLQAIRSIKYGKTWRHLNLWQQFKK